MEQTQQTEVFEQKAALKLRPKLPSIRLPFKTDKQTLLVMGIFIISVIAMLVWAIHIVDVYNGTFP
ncbi:MAG TPA: hypothetical protein VJ110_02335 [Candidatus Nanoarchaeia archaeon]|nr:hypothetical protein [Candidatus Nanoarchaeia archaeon]